jgi:hypothetical protein
MEEIEQTVKNVESPGPVSRPKYEEGTSKMQVRSITAGTNLLCNYNILTLVRLTSFPLSSSLLFCCDAVSAAGNIYIRIALKCDSE